RVRACMDLPRIPSRQQPCSVMSDGACSGLFGQHCNIELRIIFLYIASTIFLAKLLDHRFHRFRFRDWGSSEIAPGAASVDFNRWILQNVAIPLSVGALHRQQVELAVLENKPDWIRDLVPRLAAHHGKRDLAVFFQSWLK